MWHNFTNIFTLLTTGCSHVIYLMDLNILYECLFHVRPSEFVKSIQSQKCNGCINHDSSRSLLQAIYKVILLHPSRRWKKASISYGGLNHCSSNCEQHTLPLDQAICLKNLLFLGHSFLCTWIILQIYMTQSFQHGLISKKLHH